MTTTPPPPWLAFYDSVPPHLDYPALTLYEALAALVERGTDSPEHMAAERALALARGEA